MFFQNASSVAVEERLPHTFMVFLSKETLGTKRLPKSAGVRGGALCLRSHGGGVPEWDGVLHLWVGWVCRKEHTPHGPLPQKGDLGLAD